MKKQVCPCCAGAAFHSAAKRYMEIPASSLTVCRVDLEDIPKDSPLLRIDQMALFPECGDGSCLVSYLRKRFTLCQKRTDYVRCIHTVYGLVGSASAAQACIDKVSSLCREVFDVTEAELATMRDHIIYCDVPKVMAFLASGGPKERKC